MLSFKLFINKSIWISNIRSWCYKFSVRIVWHYVKLSLYWSYVYSESIIMYMYVELDEWKNVLRVLGFSRKCKKIWVFPSNWCTIWEYMLATKQ